MGRGRIEGQIAECGAEWLRPTTYELLRALFSRLMRESIDGSIDVIVEQGFKERGRNA